jgi:hypothetical protein
VYVDGTKLSEKQIEVYDEQTAIINWAQQALEALQIECEHFPVIENPGTIVRTLRTMEYYLSAIVTEYEQYWPNRPVAHLNLTRLDEFSREPRRDQDRSATFAISFARAYQTGITELAHPEEKPA